MVKEEDSRNTSMTDLRYHGLRTHGIYVVAIVLQFQAFFLKVLCTHALMSAQHSRWLLSLETLSEHTLVLYSLWLSLVVWLRYIVRGQHSIVMPSTFL